MNKKVLYLDESGKTGTQRYTEKWNFSTQPYFALCGILVYEHTENELIQLLDELRKNFKIQGEIKSTKEVVRKNSNTIISQLWEKQKELNAEMFIEIVNKKFCIAMMITNYCVFPYYDFSPEDYNSFQANLIRRNFANYICESISDDLMGEFVEFFDDNTQDISEFTLLCNKLIEELGEEYIMEFIKGTIDSVKNHDKLGLLQRHLFPLVDYYKGKCSSVAVCPHIDSFNNVLNRLNTFEDLAIVHDKISDLEDALKQTVKERKIENIMQFGNSRESNLLQIADFWCGILKESVIKILQGDDNINPIIREIVNTKVNFVSTFTEQELLFPYNDELNTYTIWYNEFFKK